ncbi:hypothetical protein FOZ62_026371 [Perkinsus olseni]|uniref:Uncharacterized protein n=1 Tax=Perkinsus olseni TaxID=32597 RepID=A0A7J6UDI4_PEROL|nr:hypothetical protein FOZ62_026371 [Perkinsus olseni]
MAVISSASGAATARAGLLRALVTIKTQSGAEELSRLYALAGAAIEVRELSALSQAQLLLSRRQPPRGTSLLQDSLWLGWNSRRSDKFPRLPIPLSVYSALARGLASQGRGADCARLWDHVTKWRLLKPDSDFFEASLHCGATAKDPDLATRLLSEAEAHGVHLSHLARSHALGAVAHSRKHSRTAWELYASGDSLQCTCAVDSYSSMVSSREPIACITFDRALTACSTNRWHNAVLSIVRSAEQCVRLFAACPSHALPQACQLSEAAIAHAIRAFRGARPSSEEVAVSAAAAELRLRNAWGVIREDHRMTLRQMNAFVEVYCSLGYWQEAVSLVLSARERWPWMGDGAKTEESGCDGGGYANVHTFKPILAAVQGESFEEYFAVWDAMVLDCSVTPTPELMKEALPHALVGLKSAKRVVQLLELAYSRGIAISQDQLDQLRRDASHVPAVQQLVRICTHLKG